MADPRIIKLAKILTDYSLKISKGDRIRICFDSDASELALECYKNILKKGAYPIAHASMPGFGYAYYKNASSEQLKNYPALTEHEVKNSQGMISIGGEYNTKEMSSISPKKISARRKTTSKISDFITDQNNWVGVEFPTNALAQDAEMSLEEFETFVYSATNVNWAEESKKQDNLKKILDKGKKVRIIGKNTNLSFSIAGRTAIKCDGKRNMPDGEVFIAPVENSTEGTIEYSFPAIYNGKEVSGIKLKFKKGRVIEASAEKNDGFLKEMLNTDKGAKHLGEFGIGVNFGIKRFVKQILFDEKIGGTVHLALGRAYKEGGGRNESAIHWDMIKDLRKEGKVMVDGKTIIEKGKFFF
jgi:aminopeptidase